MSRGQRITFLAIAALIAVVAIFVLADSSEDDDTPPEGEQSAATATPTATPTATDGEATPTPTPTETPTPEPTPPPPPLLTSGGVTELEVDEGDTVRFRVRSSTDEEIHVHGYDITREIPAGRTVNVSFPAELTGIWEIEFHNSGTQIAELRVEP
jgi:FtsP/CotA-like multicopper oxidase with cupredoxin domain